MATIERFEDIKAWQMARELTREVYAASKDGNFARDYGLRDQITRAAGSIMHNIAEGFDAETNADFINVTFERLYKLAGETRAAVRGFMTYLRTSNR